MAGLMDICSLILTSAFFIGVILCTALIVQKCQALINATKASLEERGWIVSPPSSSSSSSSRREGAGAGGKGNASVVVVKTSKKKIDHERYLDATQRGVIKALNASTFGAPSSQSQTTANANASASASALAGPSSSLASESSFGHGGYGLGSTFAHFRSQLLLPPLAQPQPQPSGQQLELEPGTGSSASLSGGRGGTTGNNATAAPASTRDSLYEMADRMSAWPSEKVEKVKRLRDQFLSKV